MITFFNNVDPHGRRFIIFLDNVDPLDLPMITFRNNDDLRVFRMLIIRRNDEQLGMDPLRKSLGPGHWHSVWLSRRLSLPDRDSVPRWQPKQQEAIE